MVLEGFRGVAHTPPSCIHIGVCFLGPHRAFESASDNVLKSLAKNQNLTAF